MITPRCSECGKPSIRGICLTCKNNKYKRLNRDREKPRFRVRCIICGRRSYSTKEIYKTQDYKCLICR